MLFGKVRLLRLHEFCQEAHNLDLHIVCMESIESARYATCIKTDIVAHAAASTYVMRVAVMVVAQRHFICGHSYAVCPSAVGLEARLAQGH